MHKMAEKYEVLPRRVWAEDNPGYLGEGRSFQVARGLLLWAEGKNQTGEGMGLGAIAVVQGGSTYFSAVLVDEGKSVPEKTASLVQKTFCLDRKCVKSRRSKPAPILTRLGAAIVSCYMKNPWLQKSVLHPRVITLFQKALSIRTDFQQCPPQAQCQIQYSLHPGQITISGQLRWSLQPPEKVYLLNELSSAFLNCGWSKGQWTGPPAGWIQANSVADDFHLANRQSGLSLSSSSLTISSGQWEKYYGREEAEDLAWAGIIYEIILDNIKADPPEPLKFSYTLNVRDLNEAS